MIIDRHLPGMERNIVNTPYSVYPKDITFPDENSEKEFMCVVCFCVNTVDRRRTGCCKAILCVTCLKSLAPSYVCPTCRRSLKDHGHSPLDETTTDKINHLKVFCINKMKGCTEIFEFREVDEHVQICPKEAVKCSNYDCDVTMDRCDLQQHLENDCSLRLVSCRLCKIPVQKRYEDWHLNQHCPNVLMSCENEGCKAKYIKRKKMHSHHERCEYRLVECPNSGCITKLPYLQAKRHEENCPMRIVSCCYCDDVSTHADINGIHLNEQCLHVPIPCSNKGCTQNMKRGFKQEHLDVCPKQLVPCKYTNICSEVMTRDKESAHYQSDEHLFCAFQKFEAIEESQKQKHQQTEMCIQKMKEQIDQLQLKFDDKATENDHFKSGLEDSMTRLKENSCKQTEDMNKQIERMNKQLKSSQSEFETIILNDLQSLKKAKDKLSRQIENERKNRSLQLIEMETQYSDQYLAACELMEQLDEKIVAIQSFLCRESDIYRYTIHCPCCNTIREVINVARIVEPQDWFHRIKNYLSQNMWLLIIIAITAIVHLLFLKL